MIKKWKTHSERIIENVRIFTLKMITREHPKNGKINEYALLDSPNWVNIIPITKEGNIVLVKQYRHGTDEITLEIPGGLAEDNEDPKDAARRECMEETGYSSELELIKIGTNRPNPAFQNNHCTTFLWKDCEKVAEQNLDGFEDIEIIEVPEQEIISMIKDGTIDHGVILTAFLFYFLEQGIGTK